MYTSYTHNVFFINYFIPPKHLIFKKSFQRNKIQSLYVLKHFIVYTLHFHLCE